VEKPLAAAEKPPAAAEKPPAVVEKPLAAVEKPQAAAEMPLAAAEKPPVIIEPSGENDAQIAPPADSIPQELPSPAPQQIVNREPFRGPENRFSRKFGEIPLVG
jgi:hypothetical protein